MEPSLADLYRAALTARVARVPKSRQPARRCNLTLDDPKMRMLVRQWDTNREELKNACIVNFFTSAEHIAWIVYEWHWKGEVPDDVWEYLVNTVKAMKGEIRSERASAQNVYDKGVSLHMENDTYP